MHPATDAIAEYVAKQIMAAEPGTKATMGLFIDMAINDLGLDDIIGELDSCEIWDLVEESLNDNEDLPLFINAYQSERRGNFRDTESYFIIRYDARKIEFHPDLYIDDMDAIDVYVGCSWGIPGTQFYADNYEGNWSMFARTIRFENDGDNVPVVETSEREMTEEEVSSLKRCLKHIGVINWNKDCYEKTCNGALWHADIGLSNGYSHRVIGNVLVPPGFKKLVATIASFRIPHIYEDFCSQLDNKQYRILREP